MPLETSSALTKTGVTSSSSKKTRFIKRPVISHDLLYGVPPYSRQPRQTGRQVSPNVGENTPPSLPTRVAPDVLCRKRMTGQCTSRLAKAFSWNHGDWDSITAEVLQARDVARTSLIGLQVSAHDPMSAQLSGERDRRGTACLLGHTNERRARFPACRRSWRRSSPASAGLRLDMHPTRPWLR